MGALNRRGGRGHIGLKKPGKSFAANKTEGPLPAPSYSSIMSSHPKDECHNSPPFRFDRLESPGLTWAFPSKLLGASQGTCPLQSPAERFLDQHAGFALAL